MTFYARKSTAQTHWQFPTRTLLIIIAVMTMTVVIDLVSASKAEAGWFDPPVISAGPAEGAEVMGTTVSFDIKSIPYQTQCQLDTGSRFWCSGIVIFENVPEGARKLTVYGYIPNNAQSIPTGKSTVRTWIQVGDPTTLTPDEPAPQTPAPGSSLPTPAAPTVVNANTLIDLAHASAPQNKVNKNAAMRGQTPKPQRGDHPAERRARAAIWWGFVKGKRRSETRVKQMLVTMLYPGSIVRVDCRVKRKCPIRPRARKAKKGRVNVRTMLTRKELRSGVTLRIRVTSPKRVTRVAYFRMRHNQAPVASELYCQTGPKQPVRRCK